MTDVSSCIIQKKDYKWQSNIIIRSTYRVSQQVLDGFVSYHWNNRTFTFLAFENKLCRTLYEMYLHTLQIGSLSLFSFCTQISF